MKQNRVAIKLQREMILTPQEVCLKIPQETNSDSSGELSGRSMRSQASAKRGVGFIYVLFAKNNVIECLYN